jgi:hypothetical protein
MPRSREELVEAPKAPAKTAVRRVHAWHTECGNCGYGSGGWAGSPGLEGKPILTPDSPKCHGCGAQFTDIEEGTDGC